MGVLDDAIRQHIELKRQHGASEDDLRRQEHEALGPARRESPTAPADGEEQPVQAEAAEAPVSEPELAGDLEAADDHEPAEEPADGGFDRRRTTVMPALVEEDADLPDPEEFHEAPATGEPEALDPDADDDVLEETPEFLQETPEHDRLWFEQKPPRDFDFDK